MTASLTDIRLPTAKRACTPGRFRLDRTPPDCPPSMRASGLFPTLSSARGVRACRGGAGFFLSSRAAPLLFLLLCATPAFAGTVEESRGEWLGNLGWILATALTVAKLVEVFRRKPPLEVEFLRRDEADKRLQRLTEKIDGFRTELRGDLHALSQTIHENNRTAETQFREIYIRLGQLRREGTSP